MRQLEMKVNSLWIILACAALFTANWFQYIEHRNPCIFCLFQRVAMAGIGLCALMNLRFGHKIEHYSCSILFALLGIFVSYRLVPFGPTFLGYSLSMWSSNLFIGSIVCQSLVLILSSNAKCLEHSNGLRRIEKCLFLLFTLLICMNIITPLL